MFEKIDLNGMSADELDLLIAQASARRLAQEPAHPTEAPEHCPTVHNPAWFTFPTEQGSVLRLRHPGLGWVSFQIPAAERAQLLNLLLNQALNVSQAPEHIPASLPGAGHSLH